MRKSSKKTLIGILTASGMACIALGAGIKDVAKAELSKETINAGFYMANGATVRTVATEAGLRWETHVSKTFVDALKTEYGVEDSQIEFHTLINRSDSELTVGAENVEDKACSTTTADMTYDAETNEFVYRVSVIYDELAEDKKTEAYQTELSANAYVKITRDGQDDVILYTEQKDTDRTIEGLALVYLVYGQDAENKAIYETFVGDTLQDLQTNETNGSLVSLQDGTGKITVDGLTEKTTYRAYIGAQYVGNVTTAADQTTATVSVSELPAVYNGEAMKAGELYDLLLLDGNRNVVKQPFQAVTQAITSAAQLRNIFQITEATLDGEVASQIIKSATEIDGYYALANDIVWDDVKHDVDTNNLLIGAKTRTTEHVGGFVGTFDGNGHVIANMKVSNGGLFGLVTGGTIKNVAFTNVIMEGDDGVTINDKVKNYVYGASQSALAFCLKDATLENVYVQANDISYLTTSKAGNRALVANTLTGNTTIKNSIFRLNAFTDELSNLGAHCEYGSICSWDYYTAMNKTRTVEWEGVYVLSPQDYFFMSSHYDRTDVVKYTEWNPVGGVTRYTSIAEMLAANNDYAKFDETVWTVEEDYIPRFTAANEKKEIARTETLVYDESKKTVNTEALNLTGETVTNITLAGKTSTYENGEWTIGEFSADGKTYGVTVETDKSVYSVNVRMVTKLLKTQADIMETFVIDGVTVESNVVKEGSSFAGYYLLANDITWDNSTTHNVDKNAALGTVGLQNAHGFGNVGLTGTFDGDGHTIKGMCVTSGGLFGFVSGGTVKNVGFSNVKLSGVGSGNDKQFGQSMSAIAFSLKNATVENVYVQADTIGLLTDSKTGNRSLVTNVIVGTTDMINCVFRLDAMETRSDNYANDRYASNGNYAYGSLCGVDYRSMNDWSQANNWDGAKTYDRANWKNVFVISPVTLSASQSWNASTPTEYTISRYDATTETYVALEAVKRYDNDEAFAEADDLDLSGFDATYWTVDAESKSISWTSAIEQA